MIEGDMDSFKYFFNKYYNDLCNFVNIYLHDQVLSEEIVQDIFVYFWENKEKLQINTSVKAYLFSVSKFKSLNLLRDTHNRKRIAGDLIKSESLFTNDEMDCWIDTEEFKKILDAAIDQLAPRCRKIFLMSKNEELSNKQIAERLNISIKTVENQITIALKKMRDYLSPYREKIFLLFLLHLLGN